MHVTFMDTVKINPTGNARYIHGYGGDQTPQQMHVTFMDTVKTNPTTNARYIHGYSEDNPTGNARYVNGYDEDKSHSKCTLHSWIR